MDIRSTFRYHLRVSDRGDADEVGQPADWSARVSGAKRLGVELDRQIRPAELRRDGEPSRHKWLSLAAKKSL